MGLKWQRFTDLLSVLLKVLLILCAFLMLSDKSCLCVHHHIFSFPLPSHTLLYFSSPINKLLSISYSCLSLLLSVLLLISSLFLHPGFIPPWAPPCRRACGCCSLPLVSAPCPTCLSGPGRLQARLSGSMAIVCLAALRLIPCDGLA